MELSMSLGSFSTLMLVLVSWWLCLAVYRLYLSPLAHIPGPKLAALTSWYECYYDIVKPGQYVWKIRDLHKQYGPIIRISPREIHIDDLEYLDEIYSARRRSKDAEKVKALGNNQSTGGAVHYDLHHKRRDSLNPFFSQKNVLALEPLIALKIEQLCRHFERTMALQEPINLSDLYFALSLDIVWQYSFGSDENTLGDLEKASIMRNNLTRLLRSVKFNLHFSWVRDTVKQLPNVVGRSFIPPGVMDLIRFRMAKIRHNVRQVLDDNGQDQTIQGRSIFYDLRDNPLLPPEEKTLSRLEDEGTLVIMAGTESTAKSIGIAQFYLLENPDIMEKLRAELRTTPDHSLSNLQGLPYLNGVVLEANRLSFGLTGRNPRLAPDETLTYHQYSIPPGTPMSMSTLCIHGNQEIFPKPWEFDPERWLGPEGMKRRNYQFAFGKGPRRCVGMNLAQAELCMSVAAMAEYNMTLFETDERDVRFQHDYHIAHARLDSKGIRALVSGKAVR